MKICVYAISKNEEKFVLRFCEAAKEADLILIADTGSTDKTVEIARQYPNVLVFPIHISPWRFDLARNAALALIPPKIEVCVSLDLDEELQPGWRQEIEKVWKEGETTRLRYFFDWGVGINWYMNRDIKLVLDYDQTSFHGGAGSATATAYTIQNRETEQILLGRAQFQF